MCTCVIFAVNDDDEDDGVVACRNLVTGDWMRNRDWQGNCQALSRSAAFYYVPDCKILILHMNIQGARFSRTPFESLLYQPPSRYVIIPQVLPTPTEAYQKALLSAVRIMWQKQKQPKPKWEVRSENGNVAEAEKGRHAVGHAINYMLGDIGSWYWTDDRFNRLCWLVVYERILCSCCQGQR